MVALYVRHWREPVILCPRIDTLHRHTDMASAVLVPGDRPVLGAVVTAHTARLHRERALASRPSQTSMCVRSPSVADPDAPGGSALVQLSDAASLVVEPLTGGVSLTEGFADTRSRRRSVSHGRNATSAHVTPRRAERARGWPDRVPSPPSGPCPFSVRWASDQASQGAWAARRDQSPAHEPVRLRLR